MSSLRDAYVFLRNVEHRLQYRDDAQTHDLPDDASERAALAGAMDLGTAGFDLALRDHRNVVSITFAQTFGGAEPAADDARDRFAAIWEQPDDGEDNRTRLRDAGYEDPAAVLAILARLRNSGALSRAAGRLAPALRHADAAACWPYRLRIRACPARSPSSSGS